MPYIEQSERQDAAENPKTPGQLNYAITLCILSAWNLVGSPLALRVMSVAIRRLFYQYWDTKIQNYTTINDIYGATACAIMEFRRRVSPKGFGIEGMARAGIVRAISKVVDEFYTTIVVDFEDKKRTLNGDVYPM